MRYVISILPLLTVGLVAQDQMPAWKGPSQSVFVVTQNHIASGGVAEDPSPNFGELIMIEIFSAGGDGYKPGRKYGLYSGGANVGRVKVEKVAPLQCNSSAALVSVDGSFRFSEETMALATNASGIRTHARMGQPVIGADRASMIRLAMAEFRKNGISVPLDAKVETPYLFSRMVDARGTKVWIGYFTVVLDGARHEILLIVGPKSRVELSWYHQTTDLEDTKDSQDLRFVDQLDLDGDGTDEIVLEVDGYESEEFWIFKRQNGNWIKVWVGGEGSC